MGLTVQIIYPKDTREIVNRKSALGSYIFCLAELLERNGYRILVNHLTLNELRKLKVAESQHISNGRSLKRFIPAVIKNTVRDLLLLRNYSKVKESLKINAAGSDVLLEYYAYGSDVGVSLQRLAEKPRVVVFDAPVIEESQFFNGASLLMPIMKGRQDRSLKEASSIVVYSNPVKEFVRKITGSDKDIRIHQNVDFTRFEFIEPRTVTNEVNIGFIGSFLKWHRVDLLIGVFERLNRSHSNIRLHLAGAGMEAETINRMAAESEASPNIKIYGFLDGEALFNFKKKLHIGIMPGSNWYGAPNKIFEYGAAGLAVVAPDTPTIKDLFPENIVLFRQDDEESFTNVLDRLINSQEQIDHLAHALQNQIREQYSEKNTLSFYDKILKASIEQ